MQILLWTVLLLAILGLIIPTIIYPILTKIKTGKFPSSYSNTYELYEEKNNKGFVFTSWAGMEIFFSLPGVLIFSMFSIIKMLLGMCSLFALLIVGRKPTSINKTTTRWHCLAAKTCAADAIIWLFLNGFTKPTIIICALGYIMSKFIHHEKYETFIMECCAFVSLQSGLIYFSAKALNLI